MQITSSNQEGVNRVLNSLLGYDAKPETRPLTVRDGRICQVIGTDGFLPVINFTDADLPQLNHLIPELYRHADLKVDKACNVFQQYEIQKRDDKIDELYTVTTEQAFTIERLEAENYKLEEELKTYRSSLIDSDLRRGGMYEEDYDWPWYVWFHPLTKYDERILVVAVLFFQATHGDLNRVICLA